MTQEVLIRARRTIDSLGSRSFSRFRGSGSTTRHGFALPTVLIVSVILLMLLVTGMSATVAVNNGLRDQYYTRLADLASDAGNAFAAACFEQGGNQITWSDASPLRPNTNCSGVIDSGLSAYVVDDSGFRTYFTVDTSMQAKGFTEAIRTTSGLAWRVWGNGTASAVEVPVGTAPVGTYVEGAWTTAPSGYLLADGAAVSRSTYGALFAVIGTTYGTGNGTTTFNLPDARGRVLVQKSTDAEFDVLAERGGEKSHTLTVAELPSHTHGPPASGISYATYHPTQNGNSTWTFGGNNFTYGGYSQTGSTGGGAAHNVIQPYITVNRAIKY